MPVIALLVLLFAAQGDLTPIAAQPAASTPPQLQGNWNVKSLATKGMTVPGGPGELLEFGEAYVTDSFLAFWAREDPKSKKRWSLFSWKDDKLTRILESGVSVMMPDSRKVMIDRTETPIHAGKRLLYFSPTLPDHIYAWDGEKLVKVLANGDEFLFRDGRYTIKRARVLDIGSGGKALVYWDSSKQHANGWALHDGSSFTPLWMEGDELPGMPGVRIENLSAGKYCYISCVPLPRLLEDGSLLASVKVIAAEKKRLVLYRLSTGKSEEIAVDSGDSFFAREQSKPGAIKLGEIFAAQPGAIVMDSTKNWITFNARVERPQFLFYDSGKIHVMPAMPRRELAAIGGSFDSSAWAQDFALEGAVLLAPESPRALLTVTVARKAGWDQSKIRSYPGIYFWDGKELSSLAWEETIGLTLKDAVEQLQKRDRWASASDTAISRAAQIVIRSIPGPLGGVSVQLPLPGEGLHKWFVPANSTDGKLQPPPQFAISGRNITLADVLAWGKPDEVLAGTEDGFFLLSRIQ